MIQNVLRSCLNPVEEKEAANDSYLYSPPSPKAKRLTTPLYHIPQELQEQSLRDYKVTIEYKHLKSHAPGGVYLVPSLDSLRKFDGVIFVRRGPYTNGIFKFVLELPREYNAVNQHPQIRFLSPIYNPYVDPSTGALDIKSGACIAAERPLGQIISLLIILSLTLSNSLPPLGPQTTLPSDRPDFSEKDFLREIVR